MKYTLDAKSAIAGEYVLGVASPSLAHAVRRRMRRDPQLAAEVARWESELHALPLAAGAQVDPPDRVWARIQATLPDAPKAAPAAVTPAAVAPEPRREAARAREPAPSWWRNIWVWQGWALAASVAALWFGVVAPRDDAGRADVPGPGDVVTVAPRSPTGPDAADANAVATNAPAAPAPAPQDATATQTPADAPVRAQTVPTDDAVAVAEGERRRSTRDLTERRAGPALVSVVSGTESGGAAWLMRVDRAAGVVRVRVMSEQSAGGDRDFELWAVPEGGGTPRSLGLISGQHDTELPLDAALERAIGDAQLLAVSVEPRGGSPAEGPTGPVRFAGTLVAI